MSTINLDAQMSAQEAIHLSERERRTVHLRYEKPLASLLWHFATGSDTGREPREYWASTWRIHLHAEAS